MSSTASVTELATPLQIQQMKHILLLSFSLILTLATSAQEPTNTFDPLGKNLNLPRMIRVMVEFIELPLPELSRLLAEPQTSANDNDLRIATGALIEAGTAKQVETQLIIARSGETSTVESITEFTYPAEYEPAGGLPSAMTTSSPTDRTPTPSIPTSFETRNLGSTLEIQPAIDNSGHLIDLRLSPQITQHLGEKIWPKWADSQGETLVQTPLFSVNRINLGVSLAAGQHTLISTVSAPGKDGMPDHQRKILVFVRAEIRTVNPQ